MLAPGSRVQPAPGSLLLGPAGWTGKKNQGALHVFGGAAGWLAGTLSAAGGGGEGQRCRVGNSEWYENSALLWPCALLMHIRHQF